MEDSTACEKDRKFSAKKENDGVEVEKSDPSPPGDTQHQYRMDGGRDAYLAILGGWILIFNSWGLSNAFGVFQTYYSTQVIPDTSHTAISWIGSIQSCLTGFTAVFGGWLLDSGRVRELLVTATFLEVFGVCVGLGSGLLAVTSPTVLAWYWERRRLLSGGIASTGGGVAGVILPIIMQRLFHKIGFGWSVRVLAFVQLALLIIALLAIRPRTASKRFVRVQPKWLKEPMYMTFVFAFACINAALYVPSFFIQGYALSLGVDSNMAFYMLSILNAATTLCRILPNWAADRYGAINLLLPCVFGTAIVAFLWRFTYTLNGLIGVTVGWSFTSGALISLPPLGIANLTKDPSEYGTRIGLGYTIAAFGALVGNPIASAARGVHHYGGGSAATENVQREFQGTWFVAGGAVTIATMLLLSTRFMIVGFKLKTKV